MKKRITVCCGGRGPDWATSEAYEVGRLLALNGIHTIYGGGKKGSMGGVADGVLDHHGEIVGFMPAILADKEIAHKGVEIGWKDTLSERKETMMALSDAFLVLPGGIGTLDELFDFWCQVKLGYQNKPIAILDTANYWWGLSAQLHAITSYGFAPKERTDFLEWIGSLEALDAWIRKVKDGRTQDRDTGVAGYDSDVGRGYPTRNGTPKPGSND